MYCKMSDLLNLALATPNIGMINCYMLHSLLQAIINRLDIGNTDVEVCDKPNEILTTPQKSKAAKSLELIHRQSKRREFIRKPSAAKSKLKDHIQSSDTLETNRKSRTEIQRKTQTDQISTTQTDYQTSTTQTDDQILTAQTDDQISTTQTANNSFSLKQTIKDSSIQNVSEGGKPKKRHSKRESVQKISVQTKYKIREIEPEQDSEFSKKTSGQISKQDLVEDSGRESNKIVSLVRYKTSPQTYTSSEISEISSEYVSRHLSNETEVESSISGIPYVEAKIKDILNILKGFPPGENMVKLFEMFLKLSPLENILETQDTASQQYLSLLIDIKELRNDMETMDEKYKEIESLQSENNFEEMMYNNQIMATKVETVENKLEVAINNIEILQVFMNQINIEIGVKKEKYESKYSTIALDHAISSKSNVNYDSELENAEDQNLPSRLIKIESELSIMKAYIFDKKNISRATSYIHPTSSHKLVSEEQWDDVNEYLEKSMKRSSISTVQNIYHLAEQIEIIHEHIKNISVNINSLEISNVSLEQSIQGLWKEIKNIQEMWAKVDDILNRVTVAEKKMNLKIEILKENINETISDNTKLKKTLSDFELKQFNKSAASLNVDQNCETSGMKIKLHECLSELPQLSFKISELGKCIEEQKIYFSNQLHYFNQLLSSKYDRWEMEWFQIWLENSLKKHIKSERNNEPSGIENASAIKRNLFAETCLSCSKPLIRKPHSPVNSVQTSTTVPQPERQKHCLIRKYLDKSLVESSSTSTLVRHPQKEPVHHLKKFWGKRKTALNSSMVTQEIWIEGLDGKLYKGSSDFNITPKTKSIFPIHKHDSEQGQPATRCLQLSKTHQMDVIKSSNESNTKTECSTSNQQVKENVYVVLPETSEIETYVKLHHLTHTHSLTNVSGPNEESTFKPGKISIYASTPHIKSVQKLIDDNFETITSETRESEKCNN